MAVAWIEFRSQAEWARSILDCFELMRLTQPEDFASAIVKEGQEFGYPPDLTQDEVWSLVAAHYGRIAGDHVIEWDRWGELATLTAAILKERPKKDSTQ